MTMGTKRILSFLAAALLILTIASTAVAAERAAVVNNPNPDDRLNLRTAPSLDAPALGKYYNGVNFEVLGDEKDGWVKVRFHNLEGYMMTQYLAYGWDQPQVASAMPTVKIKNAGGTGLNLRKTQSVNSASLGLYKNGSTVLVYGVSETWCHVQTSDGKVGFMLREHLSPEIEFQKEDKDSDSSIRNSTGSTWNNGPVGKHQVAVWPIPLQDYVAVVNNPNPADRLHLRSQPSEQATSLGKYYTGVHVIVNGQPKGDWLPVAIGIDGSIEGYMNLKYLVFPGAGVPYPESAMPILTVNNPGTAKNLNLRENPSIYSKSLGLYKNGTQVILMGFDGEWAHVIVDGKTGFMLAIYLK